MNGYLSFFILQGVERFLWRGGPAVPCYQVHSETNSPKAVPKLSLTILLKTRSCFLWKASCSRVCAYSKVTLHSWEGCSWVSEPSAFGAAPTICSPWTSSFYVLYTVPTNARVESYFRHFINSFKKIKMYVFESRNWSRNWSRAEVTAPALTPWSARSVGPRSGLESPWLSDFLMFPMQYTYCSTALKTARGSKLPHLPIWAMIFSVWLGLKMCKIWTSDNECQISIIIINHVKLPRELKMFIKTCNEYSFW